MNMNQPMNRRLRTGTLITALSAMALVGGQAMADSIDWDGSGDGITWDASSQNWNTVITNPWDSTNGPGNDANIGNGGTANVSGAVFAGNVSVGSVGAGTLNLSSDTGSLTVGGALTINNTGTLNIGLASDGFTNTNAAGALSAGSITNHGTINFRQTDVVTVAQNISGAGSVVQNSDSADTTSDATHGVTVLSGTNTYAGTTTVNAGTLQFAKAASFYNSTTDAVSGANAANLTVNSGGTAAFNVGGSGEFTTNDIKTVLTSTNFQDGLSKIGIDTTNASGPVTYSDDIGGGQGLAKLGSGTLILSGNNTYTGETRVSGGTLLVNGNSSGGGEFIVESDGVLGGTGTVSVDPSGHSFGVSGTITGGKLGAIGGHDNVDNYVGTLTIDSGAATNMYGTYVFDVDYRDNTGDLLDFTYGVDLGGALQLGNQAGTTVAGDHYAIKILEVDTVALRHSSDGSAYNPTQDNYDGFVAGLAADQTIVTWDGGHTFYLVPEPASFALLGLGGLLLLRRPSRRRKQAVAA